MAFDRVWAQAECYGILIAHTPERFATTLEQGEESVLDIARHLDALQDLGQFIGCKAVLLTLRIEGCHAFHRRAARMEQRNECLALLVLLLQAIIPQHATFLPSGEGTEEQGFRPRPILLKLGIIVRGEK